MYAHTLDAPSRIGGIFSAGRADQIVARLNQRHPLRVVVLGASVAINGGCISQLGSDCMRFDGTRRSNLMWRNESAPHKGFLVRWFGWINTTWPNAQHTLFNNAVPATTISAWIPCLFSFLPHQFDLVVLELGSMAHWQDPNQIEQLVRRLISVDPPPALLFLTVPFWSDLTPRNRWQRERCALINGTRTRRSQLQRVKYGVSHPRESWALIERHIDRLCLHYGEACISMRRALEPNAHSGRPGFSLTEIAADCLHPNTGTLGTEYVADMLVQWLQGAAQRAADAASAPPPPMFVRRRTPLPASLDPTVSNTSVERAACYEFGKMKFKENTLAKSRAVRSAPCLTWHTAYCPLDHIAKGEIRGGMRPMHRQPLAVLDMMYNQATFVASTPACSHHDESRMCPYVSGSDPESPVWIFCYSSLGTSRSVKPGLVAFRPDATLYFTVRAGFLSGTAEHATIGLVHLVSYEHMGAAVVRCIAGCSCDDQVIDAHLRDPSNGGRASIFQRFDFQATITTFCSLEVRVLNWTSSGEHKFKIVRVIAVTRKVK
jgi:hypothetical protein